LIFTCILDPLPTRGVVHLVSLRLVGFGLVLLDGQEEELVMEEPNVDYFGTELQTQLQLEGSLEGVQVELLHAAVVEDEEEAVPVERQLVDGRLQLHQGRQTFAASAGGVHLHSAVVRRIHELPFAKCKPHGCSHWTVPQDRAVVFTHHLVLSQTQLSAVFDLQLAVELNHIVEFYSDFVGFVTYIFEWEGRRGGLQVAESFGLVTFVVHSGNARHDVVQTHFAVGQGVPGE